VSVLESKLDHLLPGPIRLSFGLLPGTVYDAAADLGHAVHVSKLPLAVIAEHVPGNHEVEGLVREREILNGSVHDKHVRETQPLQFLP
jgi:hypothetical protein